LRQDAVLVHVCARRYWQLTAASNDAALAQKGDHCGGARLAQATEY
jgi:hypothetical protein